MKKMKLWQKVLLVFIVLGLIGAVMDMGKKDPEPAVEEVVSVEEPASVEEPEEEKDLGKFFYTDEESTAIYVTALQQIGEEYVSVKYPWGLSDYTFVDLSDEDDGKVVGRVKVTADGVVEKMEVICCLWTDGSSFRSHYFSCGDKVYYTDGTLEAIFQ